MAYLRYSEGNINRDNPQQQQQQQAGERKTRISFEVYPSFLQDPLLSDMDTDGAEGEGPEDEGDDDEDM